MLQWLMKGDGMRIFSNAVRYRAGILKGCISPEEKPDGIRGFKITGEEKKAVPKMRLWLPFAQQQVAYRYRPVAAVTKMKRGNAGKAAHGIFKREKLTGLLIWYKLQFFICAAPFSAGAEV